MTQEEVNKLEIKFTLESVNEILKTLEEAPYKYVKSVIETILGIAQPQISNINSTQEVEVEES